MKKLVITTLRILKPEMLKEILDLLKAHKLDIMDTDYFDDVVICEKFASENYLSITLHAISEKGWEAYNLNDRELIKKWFKLNLLDAGLVEVVTEWEQKLKYSGLDFSLLEKVGDPVLKKLTTGLAKATENFTVEGGVKAPLSDWEHIGRHYTEGDARQLGRYVIGVINMSAGFDQNAPFLDNNFAVEIEANVSTETISFVQKAA